VKAILIDPFTRTISDAEYDGNYETIYRLIDCECFDAVTINKNGETVWVDDEGLFKEDQAFFMIAGYPDPLAGKGLVLRTNRHGESVGTQLTVEHLEDMVRFPIISA
jgi:hypothetical protein